MCEKIVSTMSCSMQTVFHSVIQLLHDKTFTNFKNHENYLIKYFSCTHYSLKPLALINKCGGRYYNGALTVTGIGLAIGNYEKCTESKSLEIASACTFSAPGKRESLTSIWKWAFIKRG